MIKCFVDARRHFNEATTVKMVLPLRLEHPLIQSEKYVGSAHVDAYAMTKTFAILSLNQITLSNG